MFYCSDFDDPHTLLVLTEEELVAVDLQSEGWPELRLPYLNSLHSSAITCTAHVSNVTDAFWSKIQDAGEPQMSAYSSRVSCVLFTVHPPICFEACTIMYVRRYQV